ncbi:S1 family peptidase [Aerosakkonema funiforme]|uniref:S1 family peptidase n=1 Tax=Aerosakkonema funiforme TaxID=1246630 RepID=UPI0035B71EA4
MKYSILKLLLLIVFGGFTVITIPSCSNHSSITTVDPTQALNPKTPTKNPCAESSSPILLADDKIQEIGQKITVFIRGRSEASGVIIGHNPKSSIYYILTAYHVVGDRPGENDDPYKVITEDNQDGYKADYEKIIPEIDLAILKFTSQQSYQVASLADTPISNGKSVYVSGFIPCSNREKTGKEKQYQFSPGKTLNPSDIKSKLKSDVRNEVDKYDVYYNSKTVAGMSGSPVFDAAGRVVAIHGSATQQKGDADYCESPLPEDTSNSGSSISRFLNVQLPSDVATNLKLDCSPSPQGNVEGSVITPTPTNTSSPVFVTPVPNPSKRKCNSFEPVGSNCEN